MAYQNISAKVSSADKNEIIQNLKNIENILDFTVNLTGEERRKLRKMGAKRTSYVQSVHSGLKANPDILPASFSLDEFNKDVELITVLKEIDNHLAPLAEAVDDTLMAVGSEAMKQADTGYSYIKTAAETNQNLTGLAAQISEHFSGQGAAGSGDIVEEDETNLNG